MYPFRSSPDGARASCAPSPKGGHMTRFAIAIVLVFYLAGHAQAQSDILGTCVTDNASGRDRKDLAKWIFLAMAAHPEIKQYATGISPATVEQLNRTMAALVTRLLTDSCANETRA